MPDTATLGPADPLAPIPVDIPQLKPDENALKIWQERIDKAKAQSQDNIKKYDKHVKQYKEGSLEKSSGSTTKDNRTFPYVNTLLSLLYNKNPDICVTPRTMSGQGIQKLNMIVQLGLAKDIGDARQIFATTLEEVLTFSYSETSSETSNNAVLFENTCRGLGYSKTSFDPIFLLPRVDACRRDEVFVDPHARCNIDDAKYVIYTPSAGLPIEEAQKMFESLGYQGKPLEANFRLASADNLEGKAATTRDPSQNDDCFKFCECWSKDGAERWIDYFNWKDKSWLVRVPWPIKLQFNDFPFEDSAFNKQYTVIDDAFSDLEVVEGLRHTQEEFTEYTARHLRRTIAKKVVFDSSAVTDESAKQLKSSRDMEFVPINTGGKPVDQCIQVLNFNSAKDDTPFQVADALEAQVDKIDGMSELQQGADMQDQPELTAEHVRAVDNYSRLKLNRRQQILDNWITKQVRHMAMIARQLVTPEMVDKISGPVAAQIWGMLAPDMEDLTHEYSITIVAGSTGERAKQDKISRLMDMRKMCAQTNAELGYPAYNIQAIDMDIFSAIGEKRAQKYVNPPPPPKTAGSGFQINGASVEGLNKLMAPGTVNSPTGTIETGVPPLMSWAEARIMLGLPVVPDAEIPPEQRKLQQDAMRLQQAQVQVDNVSPLAAQGFAAM